jgi:hypothetical protein
MRKFALSLLLLVSTLASADPSQYRCEDIPWFEQTLRDLRSTCSVPAPAPGVCRALGYIGNSPEEAVNNCSGAGTPYGRAQCGADLTCPSSMSFCRAHGYVGSTPMDAIAACSGAGTPYGRQQCGENLSCQGNTIGYFIALGYVGNTPEEAINNCSGAGTPYGRQQCSAAVACRGSQYFCQNWTFTIRAFQLGAGRL